MDLLCSFQVPVPILENWSENSLRATAKDTRFASISGTIIICKTNPIQIGNHYKQKYR